MLPFTNLTNFNDYSLTTKNIVSSTNAYIYSTHSHCDDGSIYLDGANSYVSASALGAFGTGDFTIECWFCRDGASTQTWVGIVSNIVSNIVFPADTGVGIFLGGNQTTLWFIISGSGSSTVVMNINDLTWYHAAVVRKTGTLYCFLNGELKETFSNSYTTASIPDNPFVVGRFYQTPDNHYYKGYYKGYVQDVRITKGVARYTANFTPPAFLYKTYNPSTVLHLPFEGSNNDSIFIDYSKAPKSVAVGGHTKLTTTKSKWGSSSVYFDGVDDCLFLKDAVDCAFIKDFTIEFWLMRDRSATRESIFGQCDSAATPSTVSILMEFSSNNELVVQVHDTVGTIFTCTSTKTIADTDIWHHIALTRKNYVVSLWLDGDDVGNTTVASNIRNVSYNFGIASWGEYTGRNFKGYIQDFKITKNFSSYIPTVIIPTGKLDTFQDMSIVKTADLCPNYLKICNPAKITGTFSSLQEYLKTCNPAKTFGSFTGSLILIVKAVYDREDGGQYFVEGYITVLESPATRKISLFGLNDGRLIQQAWSNPETGYYKFNNLKNQEYFIWSEDYEKVHKPISHLTLNSSII
jgi:hypothetical protein